MALSNLDEPIPSLLLFAHSAGEIHGLFFRGLLAELKEANGNYGQAASKNLASLVELKVINYAEAKSIQQIIDVLGTKAEPAEIARKVRAIQDEMIQQPNTGPLAISMGAIAVDSARAAADSDGRIDSTTGLADLMGALTGARIGIAGGPWGGLIGGLAGGIGASIILNL